MRKTVKETIEQEIEKIINILCNKCGKSIYSSAGFISGGEIMVDFGYGSEFDGDSYEMHLCDDCWVNMVNDFTYMPES